MGRLPYALAIAGLVVTLTATVLAVSSGAIPSGAKATGQASAASSQIPTGLALAGRAVVADDQSLRVSEASGAFRVAIEAPSAGYLQDPAWRPDGQAVAYALFAPDAASAAASAASTRFSSDIWEMEQDGSSRLIAPGVADGAQLSKPAWSPDGAALVYVSSTFAEHDGVKGLVRRIERRDLASGRVTKLVDDGDWPTLSPDGKQLAFVRMSALGRSELWVLELATGVERQVTHGELVHVDSPRFSADGRTIAFGGSPAVPKRGVSEAVSFGQRLAAALRPVAEAHELLDGLYVVSPDGANLRRVGDLAVDGVTVRWAEGDNSALVWNEDGLYRVIVASGRYELIVAPGTYRGFDWLPITRG